MQHLIAASVILGVFVFLAALYIRGGLITLAIAIRGIARQIHVHAEVLNEIKREGINADEKKNTFV